MTTMRAMLCPLATAGMIALSSLSAAAQDIVEIIAKNPELSTFASTVKAAGLEAAMKAKGPITVLVPTNAAFAQLGANTLERLMQPANKTALESIVRFHVLPGDYPHARLAKAYENTFRVTTAEGSPVLLDATRIKTKKGGLIIDGKQLQGDDIKASNGTVYVIDAVFLPPKHRSLAPKGDRRG